MVLIACAVRDSAAAAFMRPFFVPTVGLALRSFQDEVNNKESPMHQHPADYELFQVGTFDEDSGKLVALESPRSLIRASEVKNVS